MNRRLFTYYKNTQYTWITKKANIYPKITDMKLIHHSAAVRVMIANFIDVNLQFEYSRFEQM